MTVPEKLLLQRFGWAVEDSRDPIQITHATTGDIATGEAVKGVLYWLAASEDARKCAEWYRSLPE